MRNASIFFGVVLAICGASSSFGAQSEPSTTSAKLSVNEDQITPPNGWKYRLPKSKAVVRLFNHMNREHDESLAEGAIGNPPLVPQLSITW